MKLVDKFPVRPLNTEKVQFSMLPPEQNSGKIMENRGSLSYIIELYHALGERKTMSFKR